MKHLLSTTAALSLALAPVQPWPLMAQTLAENGSVIGADGTVLCQPTADSTCDLEAITKQIEAAAAEAAAAEAAAAEAAAAEAAAADAAAAEAAAAEAAAADAAAAEAAAAEAAAAEAAAAEAATAEAADAAAQPASGTDTLEVQEPPVSEPVTETVAEPVAEPVPEAVAEPVPEQAPDASAPDAVAPDAETPDAGAPEAEVETAEPETPEPETAVTPESGSADLEATATDSATSSDPGVATEPTVEAVDSLTDLLAQPAVDVGADASAVDPVEPAAVAAAAAAETATTTDATAPTVTETVITEAETRASSEDFATTASGKKKNDKDKDDGLSDFEKVGLLALGALAVGVVLNNRDEVVANTGDRVVIQRDDGSYAVYKDDDTLLRQPGARVRTETFNDGSTRTTVLRDDDSQVVTIRDASGRVLRRATYDRSGREIVLIDDLVREERIDIATLPKPRGGTLMLSAEDSEAELAAALRALDAREIGRSFSLRQVREVSEVRALAATVDVDSITFDSGSAAIRASEAEDLADLGRFITRLIAKNPGEVFLIEGHTDAVGSAASNLALSDRRAESVAKALTEYFDVPPENLVVQGYGEAELRVDTEADERLNRRVAVRVITPLLRSAALQ